jgi:hypothetical protein
VATIGCRRSSETGEVGEVKLKLPSGLLLEIIVMIEFVVPDPVDRGVVGCRVVGYQQAHPCLLHARVLEIDDENSSDLSVRLGNVLASLALYMLAGLALRDLTNQRW